MKAFLVNECLPNIIARNQILQKVLPQVKGGLILPLYSAPVKPICNCVQCWATYSKRHGYTGESFSDSSIPTIAFLEDKLNPLSN